MSKVIVVIPNHLDHLNFLSEWEELKKVELIVIQDIGKKVKLPEGFTGKVYDHKDIEKDLGENAWIIPTQSSACRSYGYYKAWQAGAEVILTLDNDVYPEKPDYWVKGHVDMLNTPSTLGWVNSSEGLWYRGVPYQIRNKSITTVNHGLWSGVPDLDAPTSLHNPDLRLQPVNKSEVVPYKNYTGMCGMNLSWRAEFTPAMYFGIFGPEYGFDQYDDIFAGVLVKKVLDHLGLAMRTGYPSAEHRKQSNVYTNLKKQAPGLLLNEHFWKEVDKIELTDSTIAGAYKELIEKLPDTMEGDFDGWVKQFKKAALIWVNLFSS